MPRQSRGPRLYLRRGRIDRRTGKPLPDLYYIRDGASERGTGCGADRLREAERALAAYIAEKWSAPRAATENTSDPAQVTVADVLALYVHERAPKLSDPVSTAGRVKTLALWWGVTPLSKVSRSQCQAYVAHRVTQPRKAAKTAEGRQRLVTEQGARRELEDLSAAIGYWDDEHHLHPRPKVVMPEKLVGVRDALTRSQAAAMLKAARGYQRQEDGSWRPLTALTRARRRHMSRFLLIGYYTGTRPGAIMALLWEESPHQAWVSLEPGRETIYRRGKAERETTKRRPLARLPRRLAAHMRRWARIDAETSQRQREAAEKAGKDAPPPIAAVVHYAGEPIQSVRGSFAAIVADAGLAPGVTPHWLRHTAATWLMEAGASPWDAAGYMGMSTEVLETHYGHHRPDHQAAITSLSRRTKRT